MDLSNIGEELKEIIVNGDEPKDFISFVASPKFYLSILVIVIAVGLWIVLNKVSKHYNKTITESERNYKAQSQRKTIAHIMTSILKAVIVVGAVIAFLQVQGFNVSSLVAGVSVLTAVIGFALQDAIKDIVNGMYILADHYFEIGDVICYEEDEGEVIRMSIRTTKIRSLVTGNEVTISNRSFSEAHKVSEWWDIDLGLSYEENPKRVHSVLSSVCHTIEKIKGIEKCEYKGTNKFDESSIIYKIRCYSNPRNKYDLRRAALRTIQDRLDEEAIAIPYNYLNIVVTEDKRKKS